jgi:hypothetical protein
VHTAYTAIYEKSNATTTAAPHLLMKLDEQNTAKTSFKSAASELCGDIFAAECLVNGQKVLVVTVYVSLNTPSDDRRSLIFPNWLCVLQKCAKYLKVFGKEKL